MAGSEPILQARHRDTRFGQDDQRPFSVLNGIAEPIPGQSIDGPAVGAADGISNIRRKGSLNRVIEFEGETYWWHRNYVRVSVPGSGWTAGEAPAGGRGIQTLSVNTDYSWVDIGLFAIVNSNGHQELIACYCDDDTNGRIGIRRKQSKFTGDGTWGAEQLVDLDINVLNNQASTRSAYNWYARLGNNLYMQWVRNVDLYPQIMRVDLEKAVGLQFSHAPNLSTIASGKIVSYLETPHVFCGYSGIMWQMYRYGGQGVALDFSSRPGGIGTSWVLERVDGVNPTVDIVITSGLAPDGTSAIGLNNIDWSTGRSEMFVDPDEGRMFGMTFIRGSGNKSGHAIWSLRYDGTTDKIFNDGDVGWSALPPALRMQDSNATIASPLSRWKAYNLIDSSGTSTIVFEYMNTGEQANLSNWYKWNGPSVEMSFLGQGGDASWSRPNIKIGGGQRVWSPRQSYNYAFRVSDSGAPAGTLNLYTRVIGSGQAVKVRWLFSDDDGPMTKLATVQNTTSGVLSNNEVTGIIANGSEFKVEWKLQDQGISFGDEFDIHPVADNI